MRTVIIGRDSPKGKRLLAMCRGRRVIVYRSQVSHNQVEVVVKSAKEVVYEK